MNGVLWLSVRGATLYFGFYLYVFLGAPILVGIDGWLPMPVWAFAGFYSLAVFGFELYRLWPEERLEPVPLLGPRSAGSCRRFGVLKGRRCDARARPAFSSVVMRQAGPLHRQARFGRTRLR